MSRPFGTKNKQEAMVHVNLRIPVELLQYFKQFPSYTIAMRNALEKYVKEVGQSKEV